MPKAPLDRFVAKVEVADGGDCWQWTGAPAANGYAYFSIGERGKAKKHLVHRWSYEQFVGPIPADLQIDHLCRNRLCVNPDHLEPVTQTTNVLRSESPWAQKARQTHCIHGHPLSGANLQIRKNGTRQCRTCDNARCRSRYALRRKEI